MNLIVSVAAVHAPSYNFSSPWRVEGFLLDLLAERATRESQANRRRIRGKWKFKRLRSMTSPTGEKDFSLSERERDCDLSSISACDFDVLMYKVSVGNELSLAKLLVFENTSIYL